MSSSNDAKPSTSLKTSFLSMIPFTRANVHAKEAERELNNIQALIAEKKKVKYLYDQIKQGKHETALDLMMSETDMDFHYFNRLKSTRGMGPSIKTSTRPCTDVKIDYSHSEIDLDKFLVLKKNEVRNFLNTKKILPMMPCTELYTLLSVF